MSELQLHALTGGVHPKECKTLSNQTPIQVAGVPQQLIIPLQQHIGAPAIPCVAVGDLVLKGQLIATAASALSINMHAPSSGVISAIEQRPYLHVSGQSCLSIVLDCDGQDQWCSLDPITDYQSLTKVDLLNFIRDAGISGMGGAGFPTAIKLAPKHAIETLIINGTECEPYITADDLLMRERAEQIVQGIHILTHLVEPQRVIIGIEDNKPQALSAMRKACCETNFQVAELPTIYPSGGEKQLIQILTGQEVPSGKIPADIGILCQNVGTVAAIAERVLTGKPIISRITTLTGQALTQPGNYEVLIGTSVEYLLRLAGCTSEVSRLISGGPMMGFTIDNSQAPITITSNCIIAATEQELPPPAPAMPCIRCGDCAEVCPASLLPQQLHFFALGEQYEQLQTHHLFDCIECGACAYVCPSSIPLVQYYRAAKGEIRQQQRKQLKAQQAKERFDARQERLLHEEERKEAERKARAERAAARSQTASTSTETSVTTKASDESLKKLKIELSMSKVALKKAQKQYEQEAKVSIDQQIQRLQAQIAQQEAQIKALQENSSDTCKTAVSDDQLKRLKIEASMTAAALKKAEKQLNEYGTETLKQQVELLQQAAEQAAQALADAQPQAAATNAAIQPISEAAKKAKIELAMAKAAVKKAQKAEQPIEQIQALEVLVEQAQQKLIALEKTPEAENLQPKDAHPIQAEQKKLKIELAMAKAALRKAEQANAEAEQLQQLSQIVQQKQAELEQANIGQATPPSTAQVATNTESAMLIKKAKIELAMKKAALRKAEKSQAEPQLIAQLSQELELAEQALQRIEQEHS